MLGMSKMGRVVVASCAAGTNSGLWGLGSQTWHLGLGGGQSRRGCGSGCRAQLTWRAQGGWTEGHGRVGWGPGQPTPLGEGSQPCFPELGVECQLHSPTNLTQACGLPSLGLRPLICRMGLTAAPGLAKG